MVWRTSKAAEWRTPDSIPIDVSEHFRERVVPHPILLVHTPLVNYAVTRHTNRMHGKASRWGMYQVMLIGSGFEKMTPTQRATYADMLWQKARMGDLPLKTSLMTTGRAVPAARILWLKASVREQCRWVVTFLTRFGQVRPALRARTSPEWEFLLAQKFPMDSE
jgi:hypothetical protein